MNTTLKSSIETLPPDRTAHRFPRAKTRRPVVMSFIWAVPVIAAIVATVLVAQNLRKLGPAITIQFDNASGLDANQSVIRYRGVRVGSVSSIQLSPDLRHVEVRARLDRTSAGLARGGSTFWIVRPEVGAAGVHALETIVSGPYIEALPGNLSAKIQQKFIGASEAPVVTEPDGGTEFVLRANQIRSLGASSPVYFRGLQAGRVQYLDLSSDSTMVNIHILIKPSFAPLVRANSIWWNAGGINVNWHLLSGLSMTAENLRAVITGGIAFNTPEEAEGPAAAGTSFNLNERPDPKWISSSPRLNITNAIVSAPGATTPIDLENVSQQPKQQ